MSLAGYISWIDLETHLGTKLRNHYIKGIKNTENRFKQKISTDMFARSLIIKYKLGGRVKMFQLWKLKLQYLT